MTTIPSTSASTAAPAGARGAAALDPPLPHDQFVNLRNLIYEKCGIWIPDHKSYVVSLRLASRLKACQLMDFGEYFLFLRFDPRGQQEMQHVFELITTNETSFYRNEPQLRYLVDEVMPKIVQKAGTSPVRIWSAGCSTGEEPYTIAMMVRDKFLGANPAAARNLTIQATDLSPMVLRTAEAAVYGAYSLRTTPPPAIERHFDKRGEDRYAVKADVRSMVRFKQLNLMDQRAVRALGKFDLVLCRNVMIYFDKASRERALNNIYDVLEAGGHLFIGHSETLHDVTRCFVPLPHPGAFGYVKQ